VRYNDHPAATIGASQILLDIYTASIPPLPSIPALDVAGALSIASWYKPKRDVGSTPEPTTPISTTPTSAPLPTQSGPLGLATPQARKPDRSGLHDRRSLEALPPAHTATSSPIDRVAARDRAYGLLQALTKRGDGWNSSEAWFALARAFEESGEDQKAREVLWWCVELEERQAARPWDCMGGYVL
jgi:hypothetical protein